MTIIVNIPSTGPAAYSEKRLLTVNFPARTSTGTHISISSMSNLRLPVANEKKGPQKTTWKFFVTHNCMGLRILLSSEKNPRC